MRSILRFVALVLVAGSLGWWISSGSHWGWTQNQVPVRELDPVTGIEAVRYVDRLVPGLDVLALADVLALVLVAVSCSGRKSPSQKPKN